MNQLVVLIWMLLQCRLLSNEDILVKVTAIQEKIQSGDSYAEFKREVEREYLAQKKFAEGETQSKEKEIEQKIEERKEKVEHRKLMRRFNALDKPEQIEKLKDIYSQYGIRPSELSVKDLKYLIKNSKKLLADFHNSALAQQSNDQNATGLQSPTQSQGFDPSNLQSQLSPQQTNSIGGAPVESQYYSSQQPTKRKLTKRQRKRKLFGEYEVADGAVETVNAERITAGDTNIKIPDSPPVVINRKAPYMSYI